MKIWLEAGLLGLTRFLICAQALSGSESMVDMSIAPLADWLPPPWQLTQLDLNCGMASVLNEVMSLQPPVVVPPSMPASTMVTISSIFSKARESLAPATQLVRIMTP